MARLLMARLLMARLLMARLLMARLLMARLLMARLRVLGSRRTRAMARRRAAVRSSPSAVASHRRRTLP
jgi:hypothetical protein